MKALSELRGRSRRRCLRLLRLVFEIGPLDVHGIVDLRDAERLVRAGLVPAVVTEYDMLLGGRRYRRLVLFGSVGEARAEYPYARAVTP